MPKSASFGGDPSGIQKKFKQTFWGSLRTFPVPSSIVEGRPECLALSPPALAVLLVLYQTSKTRTITPGSAAILKVPYRKLMQVTGFSTNAVAKGLEELEGSFARKSVDAGRTTKGRFGSSRITLLNPQTGEPLVYGDGRNLLATTRVGYFLFPLALLQELNQPWSLPSLGGSSLKLYTSACWLANKARSSLLEVNGAELQQLTALSRPSFKIALNSLAFLGLLQIETQGRSLSIGICDPFTREPLHEKETQADGRNDPANYYEIDAKDRHRRFVANTADPTQAWDLLFAALGPGAKMIAQPDGNVSIVCPFHPDRNPSCGVDFQRQIFHCFGCRAKGTLNTLLVKLQGDIPSVQNLRAETLGKTIQFHDPDGVATAKYNYRDRNSKLIKQVLRFDDEQGKRFVQRRPAPGGTWKYSGMRNLLYKLELFEFASVIVVVEGEKDADSVNALHLLASDGGVVLGTTTGGAATWQDKFADALIGKRVIILPDADPAGAEYAEGIQASLKTRGIEHRRVALPDAKDVSEYLEQKHSGADFAELVGADWVSVPGTETPDIESGPYVEI